MNCKLSVAIPDNLVRINRFTSSTKGILQHVLPSLNTRLVVTHGGQMLVVSVVLELVGRSTADKTSKPIRTKKAQEVSLLTPLQLPTFSRFPPDKPLLYAITGRWLAP